MDIDMGIGMGMDMDTVMGMGMGMAMATGMLMDNYLDILIQIRAHVLAYVNVY
jgi:hypothetical protein